jgi:hypothetical protein
MEQLEKYLFPNLEKAKIAAKMPFAKKIVAVEGSEVMQTYVQE